jgi:hypothetical protein
MQMRVRPPRTTASFADDALVNDVQCEIRGAEAIRDWVEREVTGVKAVTTKITRAQRHYDV